MKLPTLTCTRCKHKWIPRNEQEPKTCPKCNSPYYNKPRVRKLNGARGGRKKKIEPINEPNESNGIYKKEDY